MICTLDLILISYGVLTDIETNAFERRVSYLHFPGKWGIPHHTELLREAPKSVRRQER